MTTVLYFKYSDKNTAKAKLSGVRRGAATMGWRIQTLDTPRIDPSELGKLIQFWHPQGIIIDCGGTGGVFPRRAFGKIPVVYLDSSPSETNGTDFCISHDPKATAELAARELLSLGLDHFAFVGTPEPCAWAEERAECFRNAIRLNGVECRLFRRKKDATPLADFIRELHDWLLSLPRPCGLFAANDYVAENILNICEATGLRVPGELAVIGVDNDETRCENTHPRLTSILPDFESAGYLAFKTLVARLHSPRMKPVQRSFGPLLVVRRASTQFTRRTFPAVDDALSFIREKACEGLRARDVIARMGVSRRLAELRFREMRGHSILEEIHAVRFERAKQLLLTTRYSVAAIANMCGYASETAFRKLYRKRFSKNPKAYARTASSRK